MRLPPLITAFLLYSSILSAQLAPVRIIAEGLDSCQIGSVTIQSLISNKVTPLKPGEEIELISPTDMVMLTLNRINKAPIIKMPVYLEGDTITLRSIDGSCEAITIESAAQARIEEFENFLIDSSKTSTKVILEKIQASSNSIFVQNYLSYYIDNHLDDKETGRKILQIFAGSESTIKETLLIKTYLARIKVAVSNQIFKHTDFNLISHPDNSATRDTTSKYFLYDFWYTSCAPCLRDHPMIKADISSQIIPAEVQVIGICSTASTVESWKKYLSKNELPWNNYYVGEAGLDISKSYGIYQFPTYILTDLKGEIMKYTSSYSEVLKSIKQLE